MKTIAVANQKGGVGKSTLAVHIAYAAEEAGKRVLLVDLDPQGSFSMSFPASSEQPEASTASALFADGAQIVPEQLTERMAIIRSDKTLPMLSGVSRDGIKRPARYLRALAGSYDLCIIDCPGVLGFNPPMTIAALVAANAVICPFSLGLYEGKAIADLWEYLKGIKTNGFNPSLRLMGLLPSKVHTTSREEMQALDELRGQFGGMILPLMLGERASVKQAISKRKPVWRGVRGAGHAKAAQEWRATTEYMLKNLGVLQ